MSESRCLSGCGVDGCTKSHKFALGHTLEERFWAKVERRSSDECWLWKGALWCGYGRIREWSPEGRWLNSMAHRVAYQLMKGAIPAGMHLDHVCHTNDPGCLGGNGCHHRACVNPDHLEAVTPRENQLRGLGPNNRNRLAVACIRGHEFTPENTNLRANGKRNCRECSRLRRRKGWVAA